MEQPMDKEGKVNEMMERMAEFRRRLGTVVVGQEEVISQIVITLLSGGHALLTGVPGLGKTLLVKSIARLFDLSFKRIQFTPDLMPADIIGTDILQLNPENGQREFKFVRGPIFSSILLADEINRTPPKTQAALLEAMGERHVTSGGETYPMEQPFVVLATQNPIEQEGTYPLPEAQLDRFMLNIVLDYLPIDDEMRMVKATTALENDELAPVMDAAAIMEYQKIVRMVPVSDNVLEYAVKLCASTRPGTASAGPRVNELVKWGAGSRASQALILAGKARALLDGRLNVSEDDIRALALPVLRHRVIVNFRAEAEGIDAVALLKTLL